VISRLGRRIVFVLSFGRSHAFGRFYDITFGKSSKMKIQNAHACHFLEVESFLYLVMYNPLIPS